MSKLATANATATSRATWLHFVILALSFLLARHELLGHFDSPVFGWRPADGAAIALSYFRNGFHFLFPQVFWGNSGHGYVEMEFPLVPYGTALLFAVFGAHEWVNLLIPLASGFGLVWLTYVWGRNFFDPLVGLFSAWLVAVTPVLIMLTDTGLWADPPMVLFATLGLYLIALWARERRTSLLVLGTSSASLGILLKLTALYIGIPIGYILWRKYGRDSVKSGVVWLTGAVLILPSLLWYWHAHDLYVEYHNTFGILGAGQSKFASKGLLTGIFFYEELLRRLTLYHLTPLYSIGFCFGLRWLWMKRNGLMLSWLGSIVVYIFVAAYGVNGGHYHYLLPFLPVGALTAGIGVRRLLVFLSSLLNPRNVWLSRFAVALLVLFFAGTAAAVERRFKARDRAFDNAMWMKKKITGQKLKPLTTPSTLLIVVDTAMDGKSMAQSMTPPDIFYFADRRGWYLSMAWLSVERIEELHQRGASVLVVSGHSVDDFKTHRGDMLDYLSSRYTTIMEGADGLAFALDRPK